MFTIPGHQPPVCSHPSSPPCTRLLLPSILLQPKAGIQPLFSSPVSIKVALKGAAVLSRT